MRNNIEIKAGLIPVRIIGKKIEMLFMFPNDPEGEFGGEVYQIAKGGVEEAESKLHAAIREGREELGITSDSFLHTPALVGTQNGLVVYGVLVMPKPRLGKSTFETKKVKWLSPTQFAKIGRQEHVWAVAAASKSVINWLKLI